MILHGLDNTKTTCKIIKSTFESFECNIIHKELENFSVRWKHLQEKLFMPDKLRHFSPLSLDPEREINVKAAIMRYRQSLDTKQCQFLLRTNKSFKFDLSQHINLQKKDYCSASRQFKCKYSSFRTFEYQLRVLPQVQQWDLVSQKIPSWTMATTNPRVLKVSAVQALHLAGSDRTVQAQASTPWLGHNLKPRAMTWSPPE